MVSVSPITYNINGYEWVDVTNRTVGGPTHDLRDVIACGGKIPWIVSCYSDDPPPPKKPQIKKPQEKFWIKDSRKRKSWHI